jgi:hypothetical protein
MRRGEARVFSAEGNAPSVAPFATLGTRRHRRGPPMTATRASPLPPLHPAI